MNWAEKQLLMRLLKKMQLSLESNDAITDWGKRRLNDGAAYILSVSPVLGKNLPPEAKNRGPHDTGRYLGDGMYVGPDGQPVKYENGWDAPVRKHYKTSD